MNSLNIVRVIVPPGPVHAAGVDVVGDHIRIISEFFLAEDADAPLGDDLPVEKLAHLAIRAEFPVSPGMLRVLDTADAHLASALFSWYGLSSTAEEGAVDWAELIPVESHVDLLICLGVVKQETEEALCANAARSEHRRLGGAQRTYGSIH